MVIGMTYDLKTDYVFKSGDPQDANAEFDHPLTVQFIEDSLVGMGHQVVRLGNIRQLLGSMDQVQVDLVFNIAEGIGGRNREAQVPMILELKKIPFVGSDGLTLSLTLDKRMTKKILLGEGIPTPRFFEIRNRSYRIPAGLSFPLIVKPRFEGSSKGISEKSVVHSPLELERQAFWINEMYRQPALVEEFIRGTEFTVAVIGNDPPEALPVVQIQIDGKSDLGDLFYTFSRIASGAEYLCPAQIDAGLEARLRELAIRTYQTVDCLDFGRVDFRVDRSGNPYVLEINPLPSLSTEDVFAVLAAHEGIPYEQMLGRIIRTAAKRLGIKERAVRPEPVEGRTVAR